MSAATHESVLNAWITAERNTRAGFIPLLREILNTCILFFDCKTIRNQMMNYFPHLLLLTISDSKPINIRIQAASIVIKALNLSSDTYSIHIPIGGIEIIQQMFNQLHTLGDYRLQQNVVKIGFLTAVTQQLPGTDIAAQLRSQLINMTGDRSTADVFALMQNESISKDALNVCNSINTHTNLDISKNIFLIRGIVSFPRRSFCNADVTFCKHSISFSFPTRRDALQYGCTVERENILRVSSKEDGLRIRIYLRIIPTEEILLLPIVINHNIHRMELQNVLKLNSKEETILFLLRIDYLQYGKK
ncbi:MAG: hypothetical protein EZS28_002084 [Streblomastix strix]|uniref:Uncharacterized protein n=1 Tax=Streblomastix strix TaxID=222440 RepID=A0A5J4X5V0_9EUKA|nr:MAG: hypothetical protein EZS28_002084 [Streblomastix strix]